MKKLFMLLSFFSIFQFRSVEANKLITYLDDYLNGSKVRLRNVKWYIKWNRSLINESISPADISIGGYEQNQYPLAIVNPLNIVIVRNNINDVHNENEIFKIIEILLQNGANPNFTYYDNGIEIPIIFDWLYIITKSFKFLDYLKLFLNNGLDPNSHFNINGEKYTLLDRLIFFYLPLSTEYVSFTAFEWAIKIILDSGASVEQKDIDNLERIIRKYYDSTSIYINCEVKHNNDEHLKTLNNILKQLNAHINN